jgi:beta-glucanase (GH16 family)
LISRHEDAPLTCKSPFGDFSTEYTSGSVSTRGKFSQTYGRYEFRAKFPDAKVTGSHSALWLYPYSQAYGGWPASGEIDVAEYYTKYTDRAIPYIHYVADGSNTSPVTRRRRWTTISSKPSNAACPPPAASASGWTGCA